MSESLSSNGVDIAIVGAGPAGCAAAISARARGFSVALIEVPRRSRQLPGETLHPGVEPLFRQLGVWEDVEACGFHRHTGVWRVDLAGQKAFAAFGGDADGPWRGLQVDRVGFHQILRRQALRAGVEWIESAPLTGARRAHDAWIVENAAGRQFRASTLFDATGRHAWLAKQLGLRAERVGATRRVQFGWRDGTESSTDGNPVFFQRADGWEWKAPVGDGRTAWVRLRAGAAQPGLDMTPRIFRQCAGPGWFLLGDAAGLTTPAAGNGVLRAVMSAIQAAHICAAVATQELSAESGAQAYRSWLGLFWASSVAATDFD